MEKQPFLEASITETSQPREKLEEPSKTKAILKNPLHRNHGRAKELLWAIVAAVLGIVTSVVLLAVTGTKPRDGNGAVNLFDGSCAKMNAISVGAHVLLNLAATAILFSIAACLVVAANQNPTKIIEGRPVVAWLQRHVVLFFGLLLLLSLLLHLFWNAVIFQAPGYSDHSVIQVMPSFLTGAPYQDDPVTENDEYFIEGDADMKSLRRLHETSESLIRLDAQTCSAIVAAPYLSDWSNILVVLVMEGDNDTIVKIYQNFVAFPIVPITDDPVTIVREHSWEDPWLAEVPFCNGSRITTEKWFEENYQQYCTDYESTETAVVQYCLGEPIRDPCSIKSSPIMVGILLVLHIAIIGCLGAIWLTGLAPVDTYAEDSKALGYIGGLLNVIMFFAPLIGVLIKTSSSRSRYEIEKKKRALKASWENIGFGQVDPMYLMNPLPGIAERQNFLFRSVVAGNAAQVGVAVISLGCMWIILSSSKHSWGYRVQFCKVLLFSTLLLLHWCISQSLFPVQFKWFNQNGQRISKLDVINVGYSLRAIVAAILVDVGLLGLVWTIVIVFICIRIFGTKTTL